MVCRGESSRAWMVVMGFWGSDGTSDITTAKSLRLFIHDWRFPRRPRNRNTRSTNPSFTRVHQNGPPLTWLLLLGIPREARTALCVPPSVTKLALRSEKKEGSRACVRLRDSTATPLLARARKRRTLSSAAI